MSNREWNDEQAVGDAALQQGPNDYERGIAAGERRERARVVADLRAMAKGLRGITLFERNRLDKAADRYERGEHEREESHG